MPVCELCEREVPKVTRHHLIPQSRHHNKVNKRAFSRDEVKSRIAMLCSACHGQLHALFDEKELEREHNTLESLREHPEVARFLAWIRTQDPGRRVAVRRSRRRRT